jgi:hypothetical protein
MRSPPSQRSGAILRRFGARLVVIGFYAAMWPHRPMGQTVALVSLIMAAVCAIIALVNREPLRATELSRWDEAVALLGIALMAPLIL